jgi:hypothetical protein
VTLDKPDDPARPGIDERDMGAGGGQVFLDQADLIRAGGRIEANEPAVSISKLLAREDGGQARIGERDGHRLSRIEERVGQSGDPGVEMGLEEVAVLRRMLNRGVAAIERERCDDLAIPRSLTR